MMRLAKKKQGKPLFLMVSAAMFAAMVTLTTAYLFHIPVGGNSGYIHLGDAFIYLAASFLPWPYALAASAIGASLADVLCGATVYVLPTLIIKALMVLPFTSKGTRVINGRNLLALFISGVFCVGGYFVADGLLFGTWVASFASLWSSLLQAVSSGLLYFLLGICLDKVEAKQKLFGRIGNMAK